MKILYTTRVTAAGGRNGRARSADGLLDLELSMPGTMGGLGRKATNPEQLFAGGYAACFENAVLHVAQQRGYRLTGTSVTAEVGMGMKQDGSFGLRVMLEVNCAGLPRELVEAVVKEADRLCPYSNALRGNVPVEIKIV